MNRAPQIAQGKHGTHQAFTNSKGAAWWDALPRLTQILTLWANF